MSEEIVMPRLSDTMDRGMVAKWNKKPGDPIKRGEVLLEIETDKANMELESYSDGILAKIMVAEGETADVGAPIGLVAKDEEELHGIDSSRAVLDDAKPTKSEAPDPGQSGDGQTAASNQSRPSEPTLASPNGKSEEQPDVPTPANGRIKASPLARRIAEQRGIDLGRVTGTGPGGRIVREDVESFVDTGTPSKTAVTPPPSRQSPAQADEASHGDEQIPLSRMQQTIASRLSQSMSTAPHFYVTAEIDMTHVIRMRLQINDAEPALKVSFNDLIVKAAAVVLRKFPQVNASYAEGAIIRHGSVNIGVAVDLPNGLIVPVLKDVDRKTLREIASETKDLVAGAREARLKPDHFTGGTFTVSNLGMFGVDQFTAIINPPESAILAVGAIEEKPVVVDGEIAIRARMRVTLSCDHRVIYGADAAAFLAELRRTLEHPVLALL